MSFTEDIRGIPVTFPFKPYNIQRDYMEKVIECIQNETTAVLESPTGTGKTLSLLCSSLAWLETKKAQVQAQRQLASKSQIFMKGDSKVETPDFLKGLVDVDTQASNVATGREFLGLPTIIYASRTHSQLSQACQEMKRTVYNHMNAAVLGSRDQLCVHPEVMAEQDGSARLHMCRVKRTTRSCHFFNRVDRKKEDPEICNIPIVDIEDMVKLGTKHTFCPYYMTKERQKNADVIFSPYNYLLDPVARKSLGLSLANSVVILDEGHNVEKVCEDSASIDIKSTDIALAIDEITNVMKMVTETPGLFEDSAGGDIDPEHLANLKLILMEFEKALDDVDLKQTQEVVHFPGDFIFELMEKAQITTGNKSGIMALIDNVITYLSAQNDGPFARKGKGLQHFTDFLTVAFHSKASKEKIRHCYKVHILEENVKKGGRAQLKTWTDKGSTVAKCRTLSFWCFSPGFGMDFIVSQGIKGLILTSGTLAPLKPLISELELDVTVSLENPHIVTGDQICVKILRAGPDGERLNSSFQNRDNPKYISSLGRSILNVSRIVPNGLLVFFPSYPIMQKCQTAWEQEGIWSDIQAQKAIFVEPKGKQAFNAAMEGFYEKVADPNLKGAVFMAVCRGKVSEGLDFADANGRAVIVTGLPYPPLKDPRVILKRKYLDTCHSKDKQYLKGQDWYGLEATRAVNQAIGRVIRHKNDYGAILLFDERFNSSNVKDHLSKWLRGHVKVVNRFGEIIRDLSQFFRKAQNDLPSPVMKPPLVKATFEAPKPYKGNAHFDFSGSTALDKSNVTYNMSTSASSSEDLVGKYLGTKDNPNGTVSIHPKRDNKVQLLSNQTKKRKLHVAQKNILASTEEMKNLPPQQTMTEYVLMVKSKLGKGKFDSFAQALRQYCTDKDVYNFIKIVDDVVPSNLRILLTGMDPYITGNGRDVYRNFLRQNNLVVPEDL